MIELYTAHTPNGIKIPIALEELGVPYTLHKLNLSLNEQKAPAFLKINPNGRIPAIVDKDVCGVQGGLPVFESGAILMYLADKYGGLMPQDIAGRTQAMAYLFFQVSGVGPMFGQAGWFRRNAPEQAVALKRYQDESARLAAVVEQRLQESPWLAGETYSVADIANFGWLRVASSYAGLDMVAYPAIKQWIAAIEARPATRKALTLMSN